MLSLGVERNPSRKVNIEIKGGKESCGVISSGHRHFWLVRLEPKTKWRRVDIGNLYSCACGGLGFKKCVDLGFIIMRKKAFGFTEGNRFGRDRVLKGKIGWNKEWWVAEIMESGCVWDFKAFDRLLVAKGYGKIGVFMLQVYEGKAMLCVWKVEG